MRRATVTMTTLLEVDRIRVVMTGEDEYVVFIDWY